MPALIAEGQVAPGAEEVGQARIVTGFAPAFEMGELFRGADAGAFGGDDEMVIDEGRDREVEMSEAA